MSPAWKAFASFDNYNKLSPDNTAASKSFDTFLLLPGFDSFTAVSIYYQLWQLLQLLPALTTKTTSTSTVLQHQCIHQRLISILVNKGQIIQVTSFDSCYKLLIACVDSLTNLNLNFTSTSMYPSTFDKYPSQQTRVKSFKFQQVC